jgi:putative transposase
MVYLPEHYYHVYNRGNDKNLIFHKRENYLYFLSRLRSYFSAAAAELVAYCLMPNHFHLVIYLMKEVDFSNTLRAFTTSYVRSFNNWYGRVGYLYQGNTKARLVNDDGKLLHLCRYVHLNPVVAGLVGKPEDWEFSDYVDWISEGLPPRSRVLLTRKAYFFSGRDYRKFAEEYISEAQARARSCRRWSEG